MHHIELYHVLNGYCAKVGCQLLVYTDKAVLLQDLSDYLEDPVATETRIINSAINRKIVTGLPPALPDAPYDPEQFRAVPVREAVPTIDAQAPAQPVSGRLTAALRR